MSRSLKKGPYIDYKLEKKVLDLVDTKKKVVIKVFRAPAINHASCLQHGRVNIPRKESHGVSLPIFRISANEFA